MSACNLTHRGWGFSDSGGSEERLGDSDAFAEPEDLDMLVTAGVSVVACLLVPFLCWRHPQLTVPPGALQPHLAMLNACWTLVFIAGTLLSRSQRAIFQAQLLFLSDFFAVAMNVWDLVVLVDIFYVVQDPFRPSRSRWRYYVYVALVSLVVAGPVLVSEISEIRSISSSDAAQLKLPGLEAADAVDDATWAAATAAALVPGNASSHDDGADFDEDAAAAAAASAATLCQWEWAVSTAVALWNGLFSALCVFILLALRERLSIGLATSFASRRRVLRHATVYALSYVAQDLFGDVLLSHLLDGYKRPLPRWDEDVPLRAFYLLSVPAHGLVDVVVWASLNLPPMVREWWARPAAGAVRLGGAEGGEDICEDLRVEVTLLTALGIRGALKPGCPTLRNWDDAIGEPPPPRRTETAGGEGSVAEPSARRKLRRMETMGGQKKELRRVPWVDVVGVCPRLFRPSPLAFYHYCMPEFAAAREALGVAESELLGAFEDLEAMVRDEVAEIDDEIGSGGESGRPPSLSESVAASFSNVFGRHRPGDGDGDGDGDGAADGGEGGGTRRRRSSTRRLREIVSSGASGSYFYTTPCGRYIVKTIGRDEKDELVRIAPEYVRHCQKQRHRAGSAIHYYGAFAMGVPTGPLTRLLCCATASETILGRDAGRVFYVVMKNWTHGMPQSSVPHLSFDLKGATFNRRRLDDGAAAARLRAQVRDEGLRQKWPTLLDWDWLELGLPLPLTLAEREALGTRLSADVRFLASQKLLDYSLLVCVAPSAVPAARRRSSGDGTAAAPAPAMEGATAPAAARLGWLAPAKDGSSGGVARMVSEESEMSTTWDAVVGVGVSGKEPASARLAAGVAAIDAAEHGVRVGIIDVLEAWRGGPCATRWPWQRAALSTLLWLTRAANPRGITALPPRKYAARFEEFMLSEVLALPTSWRDSLLSTWRPWR